MKRINNNVQIFSEQEMTYSNLSVNVINILRIGCLLECKKWNYPNIVDYFWHLYYNFDDECSGVTVDGDVYKMDKNTMLLIPAFTRYSTFSGKPMRHFFIHFMPVGNLISVKRKPWRIPVDQPLARQILNVMQEGPDSRRVSSLASALIQRSLVLLDQDALTQNEPSSFDVRIEKAVRTYMENQGKMIKNPEMARMLCMSVQNFERLFRKHVLMTPRELQRQYQMQCAADRLRFTQLSIEEIAKNLGYSDRYNFTRTFKQYFGVAPATYRKRKLY